MAAKSFLPHAIVQLDTAVLFDVELVAWRVPGASWIIVKGKQIMAQWRNS